MRLIRYETKPFEIPPEGLHRAKLIEIRELEPAPNAQGEMKDRLRFVYDLIDLAPLKAYSTYNSSLHPQSFLARAIHDLTGKEAQSPFDLDSLIGLEVELVLKHNTGGDGRVYANIVAIMRPRTASEQASERRIAAVTAKVREAARQPPTSSAPPPAAREGEITDEEIPF